MYFKRFHYNSTESGQIGIIIILTMVILLTVGMSLGLRTSKKQEISIEQEESTRVFNSAESGVERALSQIYEKEKAGEEIGDSPVQSDDGLDEYQIETRDHLEMYIDQGITVKAPLDSPTSSDTVEVDWWGQHGTNCSSNNPAAVIVSVYNNQSPAKSRYYAFDHCYGGSDRNNNFEDPSTSPKTGYSFRSTINLQAGDTILRIIPVYNSSKISLSSSNSVITEGQYDIISRAKSTDEVVAKAIDVSRSLPAAPSFMDYTLISGDTITK